MTSNEHLKSEFDRLKTAALKIRNFGIQLPFWFGKGYEVEAEIAFYKEQIVPLIEKSSMSLISPMNLFPVSFENQGEILLRIIKHKSKNIHEITIKNRADLEKLTCFINSVAIDMRPRYRIGYNNWVSSDVSQLMIFFENVDDTVINVYKKGTGIFQMLHYNRASCLNVFTKIVDDFLKRHPNGVCIEYHESTLWYFFGSRFNEEMFDRVVDQSNWRDTNFIHQPTISEEEFEKEMKKMEKARVAG